MPWGMPTVRHLYRQENLALVCQYHNRVNLQRRVKVQTTFSGKAFENVKKRIAPRFVGTV